MDPVFEYDKSMTFKENFNVWYDEKTLLWLKMSYEKLGQWEYRLKNYAFY